jgi:hypothetical protein
MCNICGLRPLLLWAEGTGSVPRKKRNILSGLRFSQKTELFRKCYIRRHFETGSGAHPVPSWQLFSWEYKGLNTKLINRLHLLLRLKMWWLKLWTGNNYMYIGYRKIYYFSNCFTRMLRGKYLKYLCFTTNCSIKYFLLRVLNEGVT